MKKALFATLVLVSAQVMATEAHLHAGAWSQHFSDEQRNETHDLIAVEVDSYMAGYFENSYSEDALFAAKRWSWQYGNFEAGIAVGAVYGYRSCTKGTADRSRRLCPLVYPSLTYTKYVIQPSVLVLGNAVAVSIRADLSSLFGDES
ncbi:hypothetical protein [Marinobacter algicola]|uniref:Uncharacterized protein n=1 Tax=Marinobacter algicola DG893 TaxID=443152 RepID=A6F4U3_9GAMM|nr:hypothetical protein [Marinobacter algicola]EDM46257.1 hypothetical protein MDG893_05124 [Marinobacter algicola DG893]